MNKKIYLTGVEKMGGKSFASLSLAKILAEQTPLFDIFKLFSEKENSQEQLLEKLTSHRVKTLLPIDTAITMMRENPDELLAQILTLISPDSISYFEGSDFQSDNNMFEYEFNIRLAAQLGCEVIIVLSAKDRGLKQLLSLITNALAISMKNHANVIAVMINRVPIEDEMAIKQSLAGLFKNLSIIVIPEFDQLANPTVGDVAKKLSAQIISGENELHRPVKQITVAAKTIANFLESRLDRQGMLIITPNDRIDILLGTLLADQSANYPKIAGIVLTGGEPPRDTILNILLGLEHTFPVLLTTTSTYETATTLFTAEYRLHIEDMAKVEKVVEKFAPYLYSSIIQLISHHHSSNLASPAIFLHELVTKARATKRHIVLPEGEDSRILIAADYLLKRKIVDITLLGDREKILLLAKRLQLDLPEVSIIELEKSEKKQHYAEIYLKLREHKNINLSIALERMNDVNYFAVMMVYCNDADGMVSGAEHTTADTVRPALEIIRTKPNLTKVSSVFIMCMPTRVLIYGDCAINPEPDSAMLAEIALQASYIAESLGIPTRIALLSYSSGSSGKGESVDKVTNAFKILQQKHPELLVEGPIQYDAAVDPEIATKKLPHSKIAGKATILIFPDLNTGNNTYKAVQRESGALAIGPLLLGLNKPVNDLSRGCTFQDIINTILVTAIQAGDTRADSNS